MKLDHVISKIKTVVNARRYETLRIIFDEQWYLEQNADVRDAKVDPFRHFIQHGWGEGRVPARGFSLDRMRARHPELADVRTLDAFADRFSQSPQTFIEYDRRQRELAAEVASAERLIVFFNVARDVVGGGMLSINRFVANTRSLFADSDTTRVVVSGVPLGIDAVKHSFFQAAAPQIEFPYILEASKAEDVWLFVPEVFAIDFAAKVTATEREWLLTRRKLTIVIMNQNDDLMPSPTDLQGAFFPLSPNVIVTTAHTRYCTQRSSSRYGVPFKQLTPFLPPVAVRAQHEKERVIMLSPDPIEGDPHGITREQVVKKLEAALPEFEFVTVRNMSVDQYLDLASRAMFSLTFGEGLDGYFIEPVLGGGVSFAIYNSTFFPERFHGATTLYLGWTELLEQLPAAIRELAASPEAYAACARELHSLVASEYSNERSLGELSGLFDGELDYQPGSVLEVAENDLNIKRELELRHGFRFLDLEADAKGVITPDGAFLRHLGGEFYSVLYEVYVRRDYDFDIDPASEYVLVDVGCNFGLVSIYLTNRFGNIVKSYAYEPANPTARLARKNFEYNASATPIILKQIGLSDGFDLKTLEFIPDWSTAFSTDNEVLLPYLRQSTSLGRRSHDKIEVEVVPASTELASILQENPGKRILVKCDTQGSEFAIVENLEAAGLLSRIDQFIVESHFRDPAQLIASLQRAGFAVNARLDSAANRVYTITANRRDANAGSPASAQ
ncbi:FkbM family methyltransferase [Burkholderia multivorans]|nr:FkbM family methyltransferase [Burkholderia multivorans]